MKSIWMNAWDLLGASPEAVAGKLKARGLNACSLSFSYHGGRMLLPQNAEHVVYEQNRSAVYFPTSKERYRSLQLKPHVAAEAELVPPFVEACHEADIEVNAWTVLCHNDRLGAEYPDCCVENAFGDRYTYALCPSHSEVRRYARTLCADIASISHLARIELEALSFMGYQHGSLHDKSGVPLPDWVQWLLSICFCSHCRGELGEAAPVLADRVRTAVRAYLQSFDTRHTHEDLRAKLEDVLGTGPLEGLLAMRRRVIMSLLDDIRRAVGTLHLNVRMALSSIYYGGKSALEWEDLRGRADSATVTFFGASKSEMAETVRRIPSPEERPVPVYGGVIFHRPDCDTAADVQERTALLRRAEVDGLAFYCLSLATERHLDWLETALSASEHSSHSAETD